MKVNILGQEYEIIKQTKEENPKLEENYAICEIHSKKIVMDSEIGKNEKMAVERLELFENKVLRHEIIHAFLAESGLDGNCDYARNEELVDWIAYQVPKMWKVFQELGGRRMTRADLMKLVGKKVHIYFKGGEKGIYGTLGYADDFSAKHGYRKPDYFYIGNTSFKVSHIRKVAESEEEDI